VLGIPPKWDKQSFVKHPDIPGMFGPTRVIIIVLSGITHNMSIGLGLNKESDLIVLTTKKEFGENYEHRKV